MVFPRKSRCQKRGGTFACLSKLGEPQEAKCDGRTQSSLFNHGIVFLSNRTNVGWCILKCAEKHAEFPEGRIRHPMWASNEEHVDRRVGFGLDKARARGAGSRARRAGLFQAGDKLMTQGSVLRYQFKTVAGKGGCNAENQMTAGLCPAMKTLSDTSPQATVFRAFVFGQHRWLPCVRPGGSSVPR